MRTFNPLEAGRCGRHLPGNRGGVAGIRLAWRGRHPPGNWHGRGRRTGKEGLAVASLAAAEAAEAGREVGGGGSGRGLVVLRHHEETGVPPGQRL
jgi:hypothetical protein